MDDILNTIIQPCMSKSCREYISRFVVRSNIRKVVEFGSGGSTKMFDNLGCIVVTIENNPKYFDAVRILCKDSDKVYPIFVADLNVFQFLALTLCSYSDLIFIDSNAWREHIMDALADFHFKWKTIMVHDSERKEYHPYFEKLRKFGDDISPEGVNLFICRRRK